MRLYTSNSLQQLKTHAGAQVRPDIPQKLYLDITEDCNMYCIMCREKLETRGQVMDMVLYKRIVDETCKGVTSYSLYNWGESLLVKDFRERLIYLANRKRSSAVIDLSTNGTLLTKDMGRFLLDHDVEVIVSFDGADKATFEKIRRGGNFSRICANLEQISSLASNMNPYRAPGIYISIQKDNWKQLVDIVKLAHELGAKKIGMGPVTSPIQFRIEPCKELLDNVAEAINHAESMGIVVDIFPTKLGDHVWDGERYVNAGRFYVDTNCDAPLTCATIAWNGDVFLCCNVGDFADNITNKSFSEVWMSDRYNELRENVNNEEKMPPRCRDCSWVNRY